jgi:hypothetical protein
LDAKAAFTSNGSTRHPSNDFRLSHLMSQKTLDDPLDGLFDDLSDGLRHKLNWTYLSSAVVANILSGSL